MFFFPHSPCTLAGPGSTSQVAGAKAVAVLLPTRATQPAAVARMSSVPPPPSEPFLVAPAAW